MTRRVLLTRRAERDLDNLDPPVRDRIIATLRRFARSGHGDVKKLKGQAGRWRLRVGGWRVLFTVDETGEALVVLRVLPRGKAYRKARSSWALPPGHSSQAVYEVPSQIRKAEGEVSQQRPESASDPRLIRMADYYDTWSTRERAWAFYPDLWESLEVAPSWGEIVISFGDVSFVSPSFLDEILVHLSEDRPDVAKRVVIRRLSPFTARRLRSILGNRKLTWTLRQRKEEGEYEVFAQIGDATSTRVLGSGERFQEAQTGDPMPYMGDRGGSP